MKKEYISDDSKIDAEDIISFESEPRELSKFTEEHIPFLKRTLYDMDELTEKENVAAKKILVSKITTKISIVERLILMIRIKEQIVGRKKRRFYIEDDYFINEWHGNTTHSEVFAQLVDGNLEVSGGIVATFKPYYPPFDEEEVVRGYHQESVYGHRGHWEISRNFKELRFNYNSDKRWGDERTYEGTVI